MQGAGLGRHRQIAGILAYCESVSHDPAPLRMPTIRREELLSSLRDIVLVQGSAVHDGWRVTLADAVRGRLLVVPPDGTAAASLRPGATDLVATSQAGLVELPANVVAIDDTVATLSVDLHRASIDSRRTASRHAIALPIRGRPVSGGPTWSGSTRSISSGGALVDIDAPLANGSEQRVAISIDGTEVELPCRVDHRGGRDVILRFDGVVDSTRRALGIALLRARTRRAA